MEAILIDLKHTVEAEWPLPIPAALKAPSLCGHVIALGVRAVVAEAACAQMPHGSTRIIRDRSFADQRQQGEFLKRLLTSPKDAISADPASFIREGEIPVFVCDAPTLETLGILYFLWASWKEGDWIGNKPNTNDTAVLDRHRKRFANLHRLSEGSPSALAIPQEIHAIYEKTPGVTFETCLEALTTWFDRDRKSVV